MLRCVVCPSVFAAAEAAARAQSLDTQLALKTAQAELEQRNELLGAWFP